MRNRCRFAAGKARKSMDADCIELIQGIKSYSIATAMYDVCSWGDIGELDGENKENYYSKLALYPVGYEVSRVMRLAIVPKKSARSGMGVVDASKDILTPLFISK